MTARKRYSERRAQELYNIVSNRITDFRIAVLRGLFDGLNQSGQENKVYEILVKKDLAAEVVAEYKRNYTKEKK